MTTINVETKPTKVSYITEMSPECPEWYKEFELEHKVTINGEETSIKTIISMFDNNLSGVVDIEQDHPHGLVETYIRGIVIRWLIDEKALDTTSGETLEQTGRVYLFSGEEYTKIVHFLETMSEQIKENNSHEHQH